MSKSLCSACYLIIVPWLSSGSVSFCISDSTGWEPQLCPDLHDCVFDFQKVSLVQAPLTGRRLLLIREDRHVCVRFIAARSSCQALTVQSEGICVGSLMQQEVHAESRSTFSLCVSCDVAVVVQFLPAGKVRGLLSFKAAASHAEKAVLCL